MQRFKQKKLILFILGIFTPLSVTTSKVNASSFGAEIFCTMRDGGNDHESSWEAAYTYIKKQKGGIFKVSPKQAASQITETVIRESEEFNYCIEFLDNLHPNRKLQRDLEKEEERKEKEAKNREDKRKKDRSKRRKQERKEARKKGSKKERKNERKKGRGRERTQESKKERDKEIKKARRKEIKK